MMRLPLTPETYNGGLPTGGTTGQVLAKNSGTDFDVGWATVSGGGGGVSDGDKGDITVSGTGTVWTVDAGAITVSKMANLAASTILGNNTGVAAAPIALTVAQVKTLLAIAAGDVSGLSAMATSTDAANLTGTLASARLPAFGSGDVSFAAAGGAGTIAAGSVTLAKMANMATASLIYRKTAGTGAPEVNTLATLKTDLGLTGTNSGDQTITLTGDVTGSGTGSFAATLATVNANVGSFGSATQVATFTVDGKGRTTAAGNATIAIASTAITDFNSAARAQVEAELIAGTNVTITPGSSGATRTLTIAASGGGGGSFDYGINAAMRGLVTY